MTTLDEIVERRRGSVFHREYSLHGPELINREGKCYCCGRSFDYLEALNLFEEYIEDRNGSFFAFDSFRDEMCADCGIRTLKNSTWMEIL